MLSAVAFPIGLLALVSTAAAQTWTTCNPLNSTNCPLDPALGQTYNFDFSQSSNSKTWNTTSGKINYGANGGEFTINQRYDSPTIQSEWYIFFGEVEVHMRAASGQGIISSVVFESDDLDEIDWEMMGGNNTHVETNYFGKGDTSTYDRAIYYPVETPLDIYHNYTVRWTQEKIEWFIDTNLVRTLNYNDAVGGTRYPQTPMTIRLGIWAGGDPGNSKGTIEWAGGLTDFTKGPYTMYVQSARITDYSTNSTTYQFGDETGNWQSIKVVQGNSTAHNTLAGIPNVSGSSGSSNSSNSSNSTSSSSSSSSSSTDTSPSISDKWAALSPTTKIGIYAGAGGAGAIILGLLAFCCIRQRRRGKKERQEYEAKLEAERREAEDFKLNGMSMDSLPQSATPRDYETSSAGSMTKESVPEVPPLPQTYANPAAYGEGGLRSPNANQNGAYGNGGLHSPNAYSSNQEYFGNDISSSRQYSNNGYSPATNDGNDFQGNGFSRQASAASNAVFQPNGFSRQASASSAAGFQPSGFSRQASGSSNAGYQSNAFPRQVSGASNGGYQPSFSRQASAASNGGFQPNAYSRSASPALGPGFQAPNFSRQASASSNSGGVSYSSRPGGNGFAGKF